MVNLDLYCIEQLWSLLHLVNDKRPSVPTIDECRRIIFCRLQIDCLVQCQMAHLPGCDKFGQRGFATLPGTGKMNASANRQTLAQHFLLPSFYHQILSLWLSGFAYIVANF